MIRLALVGFGGYGRHLSRRILELSADLNIRLVAAADTRRGALSQEAEHLRRHDVTLYDDALTMFQDLRGACEAVYIAAGIPAHEPLAVAAADAGFHIHLEKPPAATIQEIDRIRRALSKNRRMCLVGFQGMTDQAVGLIKQRVVGGRLGKVGRLTCRAGWPRKQSYFHRNDWAGRLKTNSRWVLDGPVTNALAHEIARMLYLASPRENHLADPTTVRAELYAAGDTESHDTAAVEVCTAADQKAVLVVTHRSAGEFGPILELQAEGGTAVWGRNDGAKIKYADGSEESCPPDEDGGRTQMIARFIEALRADDPSMLRCPLDQAAKMTLAGNGAHESSGRIHRIPADLCRELDAGADDKRIVVEGLDALVGAAADGRCLFADLPNRPGWAVQTDPFDLTDYRSFPQRFQCD